MAAPARRPSRPNRPIAPPRVVRVASSRSWSRDGHRIWPRWRRVAGGAALAVATLAAAVAVASMYLHRWPNGVPIVTRDVTHYLWRTKLVSAAGAHALVSWHPANLGVQGERSGLLVLLGILHVSDPTTVVLAVRAVAAIAVGLAAGAFAIEILGERWYALPAFLLGVGASVQLARTSIGYLDNLVADAVLLAAAVAALHAVDRGRGRLVAIAAIGAGMLIHWFFALLFLVMLAGVTITLVPAAIRSARTGVPIRATPAWRLGTVVGGAGLACAIAACVVPRLPGHLPPTTGDAGIGASAGPFWLPQTIGLSILGGAALVAEPPRHRRTISRRSGLALAALWALAAPIGLAVSAFTGDHLKLFRIAAFALGIPLLVSAAAVAAASLPRWRWLRAVGALLGASLLAVLFVHAQSVATSQPQNSIPGDLNQVRLAGSYLEGVPGSRPVVFLSAGPAPRILDGIARSEVPPRDVERVWVYPGTIEGLDAGGPSMNTRPKVERQSSKWWAAAWPDPPAVLDGDPIVLYLSRFNRLLPPPIGATRVAQGVFVVRGPAPARPVAAPPALPGPEPVGAAVAWMAVLLALAGSGWAVALLDGSWLARAALAPAIGIVGLVLTGSVLARLGVAATGGAAWVVLGVVAAVGWAVFALRIRGDHAMLPRWHRRPAART